VGDESDAHQSKLDRNDISPAGYDLAHVEAGVALAAGPQVAHLDVTLRNALDKKYQSFLSRYKFASDPIVLDPAGTSYGSGKHRLLTRTVRPHG